MLLPISEIDPDWLSEALGGPNASYSRRQNSFQVGQSL